jgi:hypothetical protein
MDGPGEGLEWVRPPPFARGEGWGTRAKDGAPAQKAKDGAPALKPWAAQPFEVKRKFGK